MGFSSERFPAGTHMCLIYSDEQERRDIVSKYLKGGLSADEKVAYFVDEASPEKLLTWLAEMGIVVPEDGIEGFSIDSTADTYYPDGKFDPDAMLDNLKAVHHAAVADGYSATRVTGEMTWALKGVPGSERLIEYESRVNSILVDHPVTAMCQYDANKFDGGTIYDCLKVHPYMIAHGQIARNPFYMTPEEFLKSQG
jgi:hypothetical protein